MASSSVTAWHPAQPADAPTDMVTTFAPSTGPLGSLTEHGHPPRRPGRPPGLSHRFDPGPKIIVVLVGAPQGRWKVELTHQAKTCQRALGTLAHALGLDPGALVHEGTPNSRAQCVGVAVLEAWNFVRGPAAAMHTFSLMQAACAAHGRRKQPHFLEHRVLAAATLGGAEAPAMPGHMCNPASIPRITLPADIAQSLSSCACRVTLDPLLPKRTALMFNELVAHWASTLGIESRTPVPWPAWTPLAEAMAKGVWSGDVTPLYGRDAAGATLPAVHPGRAALQGFTRTCAVTPQAPASSAEQQQQDGVFEERHGFTQAYSGSYMARALEFALPLSSGRNFHVAAGAAMRFLYPRDWRQRLLDLGSAGHRLPHGTTLDRARQRFDCAAMLLRRAWYAQAGPTFRYVGIDASPQRPGLEVLVTVERVILHADVVGLAPGHLPPVEQRKLPISVLGHGRCGLAEKVQATLHQTWLDYGASIPQLRAANLDVRQVTTDMGTEFAIGDYFDVVGQCLRPKSQPADPPPTFSVHPAASPAAMAASAQPVQRLYPLALATPGVQHILDNALREVVHQLPGWAEWQAQAKTVCQWLGSLGHRQFLQARLPQDSPDTPAHMKAFGHNA